MPGSSAAAVGAVPADAINDVDAERRFGALRRLWGDSGYRRLRAARVAVVGLGGVGSWAVEALVRSGVAAITLIDFDHVAESNINRQLQALGSTLGQAKGDALRARIADIHPGCVVHVVDAFVEPDNWPALLPAPVDGVVDACDQVRAKLALAQWALASGTPLVSVGAAGGKLQAQQVEVVDLAAVTHDPLLAARRQRLRKCAAPRGDEGAVASQHQRAARARKSAARPQALGVRCVFSREAVRAPIRDDDAACAVDGSLNCHGYGSSVAVTASFGMVAAGELMRLLAASRASDAQPGATLESSFSRC